jgi:hypothetical protein
MMDSYSINDEIKVTFNLSGRLWSGGGNPEKCFTSLQAWKVESAGAGDFDQTPPLSAYDESQFMLADGDDDIPF